MNTIFVQDRLDRQSLTDTWTKTSISRYIVLSENASSGAHHPTRMRPLHFLHRTRGFQRPRDEAPHFTEVVSASFSFIRVT